MASRQIAVGIAPEINAMKMSEHPTRGGSEMKYRVTCDVPDMDYPAKATFIVEGDTLEIIEAMARLGVIRRNGRDAWWEEVKCVEASQ